MKRHPPHLKGRQIGLYHAKKNKLKRLEEEKNPPVLGTILLADKKKKQISELIEKNKREVVPYVDDVAFQRTFLDIVRGTIDEKLEFAPTGIKQDRAIDDLYRREFEEVKGDSKYKSMLRNREKLPAFEMRKQIVDIVEESQICVISGETGCGKTTQVAQFILDDYLEKGRGSLCRIICTQPRRISAIAIAMRVAEERAENLGNSVGYQIRLERELPRLKASITYCTTGVILKQMESNPNLEGVSHLILDEIHERGIMSDFIISLLKKITAKRKDLKVILMSATLNSEAFSKYYNDCPMLTIPGFTFHVEEYYLEEVIMETRFDFGCHDKHGRKVWKKKDRLLNSQYRSYYNEFGPYLRQLGAEQRYPMEVIKQLENPSCEELNYGLIMELIMHICHRMAEMGAILVFLPGYSDISQMHSILQTTQRFNARDYLIVPLHSQMPTVDQRQIFDPPPPGKKRKIILSTPVSETSITIDDVVYVIDCGRHKLKRFCAETNNQTLLSEWITIANAKQRKGRAGRVKPGICYHLYHRGREQTFDAYPEPEILRTRLEDVILMIKILQLGKVHDFLESLLDKPDLKTVDVSLNLLKRMNALDEDENLTPLGFHLAKLPVHPQVGKMLLLGAIFSCLDPILSVAVSLDYKDAFQLPLGKEEPAELRKLQLADDLKSDHILSHLALMRFEECSNQSEARKFCWDYFLSYPTLNLQQNMKRQFMEYLHEMKFVTEKDPKCPDANRNADNMSLVKAVICAGLYPNIAINRMKKLRKCLYTLDHKRVQLHRKSVLAGDPISSSPFLVYFLRMKSANDFIHDATIVHPLPLIFFGDRYKQHQEGEGLTAISVNNCLKFRCSESTMALVSELRNQMNWILEYKISNPGPLDWTGDSPEIKTLIAIMELITNEDTGDIDLSAYDDFDDK